MTLRGRASPRANLGQHPVFPRLQVPAPVCPPGVPRQETTRRKGTTPSVPTMPQPPPGPLSWGHPRGGIPPSPTTHLQSSVFGRQVGVVIPAGRDALEEDLLGRAVVVSGEEDGPFLGGGMGGGLEAGLKGTRQAQPQQQPQRRGHRGGSGARRRGGGGWGNPFGALRDSFASAAGCL